MKRSLSRALRNCRQTEYGPENKIFEVHTLMRLEFTKPKALEIGFSLSKQPGQWATNRGDPSTHYVIRAHSLTEFLNAGGVINLINKDHMGKYG